jgi:hypothetical protein
MMCLVYDIDRAPHQDGAAGNLNIHSKLKCEKMGPVMPVVWIVIDFGYTALCNFDMLSDVMISLIPTLFLDRPAAS